MLLPVGSVSAQGCGISVAAQPPVVDFPGTTLPGQGTFTYYEILNVNYSSAFVNQTVILQYFNGTQWRGLDSFTRNAVGFTEADVGVDSSWAHFGENSVRAISGTCASSEASFVVRPDSSAIPEAAAAYILAGLALLMFYIFGGRLGRKRFVLLAVAFYLAVAPFTGQRYDIYFLLSSGIRILQHVNPFDPGNPQLYPGSLKWAYPPLYAVYSAISFSAYQLLTGAPLPSVSALTYPGWLSSTYSVWEAYIPSTLPVLVLLLKLPMVMSAIWTGILVGKMTGDEHDVIKWVANPLVVLVAAVWGQLDPIATLLAVGSVYMFQKGRPYHAYALASLGAAVKIWPVLLVPIMFVIALRRVGRNALKPLLAVFPALIATLALYAVHGNLVESLFIFLYARGIPTFAGQFSVNGLTWQQILFVLKVPPLPLFLAIGIPAYAVMLGWIYWKKEEDVTKWLTAFILVFYLTYNYVNPQYFYWILPLMMIQKKKVATFVVTLLPLAYVFLSYNIFYFVSPAILPDEFTFGGSIVEQLKVNAFYQSPESLVLLAGLVPTAAYVALLYREIRRGRTSQA
ncbi:MAG: hypothetical protein KGI38_05450 [Thaumarchaeota archaeon]|nr:hypothetical protein [Nitrososphaerota archaeon]